LVSGLCAGALALGGLLVVRHDAPALYTGLTHGGGAAMVGVSAAAGLTTLALVWRSRLGPARVSAALAVAAIVAGWPLPKRRTLLPDLPVAQAPAPGRAPLLAVIISVAIGAVVLIPSLALLFRLFLRGALSPAATDSAPTQPPPATGGRAGSRLPAIF